MCGGDILCCVSVEQSDHCWNKGPAVTLYLAAWMQESAAEGAAQGPHGLMQGVGGVVRD